ncbi:hypothetical protein [Cellulomonas rhizosphaerae]|uniref:Uncharacterized protein n=1 Tax=Cellulomonas rhizosphaerae TaxID=2293719 RepID=A0A413RKX1_9CELL|nr:hypothetical protein [Cellulomonas rhizosphaerae]RHA40259.1 hypothetical protein D1825_10500 [Cellulomonas rhizosphaerae]
MLLVRRPHAEVVASAREGALDLLVGPTDSNGWTAVHAGRWELSLSDVKGPAILLGDDDDPVRLAVRRSDLEPEVHVPWDAQVADGSLAMLLAEMFDAPEAAPRLATWLGENHLDDIHAASELGRIVSLPDLQELEPTGVVLVFRGDPVTTHLAVRATGPAWVAGAGDAWQVLRAESPSSLEWELRSALRPDDILVTVTRWGSEVAVEVVSYTSVARVRWHAQWERSLADPVHDGETVLRALGSSAVRTTELAVADDPLAALVQALDLPTSLLEVGPVDAGAPQPRATGLSRLIVMLRIEWRRAARQDRAERITLHHAQRAFAVRAVCSVIAVSAVVAALLVVTTDGAAVGWEPLSTYRRVVLIVGAVGWATWSIGLTYAAWRAGRRLVTALRLHRTA